MQVIFFLGGGGRSDGVGAVNTLDLVILPFYLADATHLLLPVIYALQMLLIITIIITKIMTYTYKRIHDFRLHGTGIVLQIKTYNDIV